MVGASSIAIFTNDFEEGDLTAWTGTILSGAGNTVAVEHNNPHHNLHNAIVTVTAGGYAIVYKTITSATTIYCRVYAKWASNPTNNTDQTIIEFKSASAGEISGCGIMNDAGTLKFYLAYLKNGTGGTTLKWTNAFTTNTWYCLELYTKISSTVGAVELWVDGVSRTSDSGFDNNDYGNCTGIYIGAGYWFTNSWAHASYIDCVKADTVYVGTEGLSQSVTDTLTISDSGVKKGFVTILTEPIAFADAQRQNFSKKLSDALTIASETAQSLLGALSATITDIITFVDAQKKNFTKRITDAITTADAQTKNFSKRISDAVTVASETIHNLLGALSATITDIITFVDAQKKNFTKRITDAITTADAQTKNFSKRVSDALTVASDAIGSLGGGLSQIVTDTITFVDSIIKNFVKVKTESLSLSSSTPTVFSKHLTESITIVENRIFNFIKRLTDTLGITGTALIGGAFEGAKIMLTIMRRKISQVLKRRKIKQTVEKRKIELTVKKGD